LEIDYPELVETFQSMTALDPSCRPTTAEAFKSIDEYHDGFTRAQLKGPVPEPNLDGMSLAELRKRVDEANERQEAREKKRLEAALAQTPAASP
jgi:hypothetical protein